MDGSEALCHTYILSTPSSSMVTIVRKPAHGNGYIESWRERTARGLIYPSLRATSWWSGVGLRRLSGVRLGERGAWAALLSQWSRGPHVRDINMCSKEITSR